MKKLILTLALLITFTVCADDRIYLPDESISTRGYIIKDVKALANNSKGVYNYTLPALGEQTTWTYYRVCLTSFPALVDWSINAYEPYGTNTFPKVALTTFVSTYFTTVRSWEEPCSDKIDLNISALDAVNVKVKLYNLDKYDDIVAKITIKVFNTTNHLPK